MDPKSSFSHTFDLNTQKGVMSLLAALRQSSLTNDEKNELRDLVFSYTNGGGDISIKIALEQKLKTHQIHPLPIAAEAPEIKVEPPRPPLPFGSSRPAPVFNVPIVLKTVPNKIVVDTTISETVPVENAKVTEEVKPAPTTLKSVERQEPKPVAVTTPKEVLPSLIPNTNVYLDRIREIKTAVNSQVGNPVNLVDIDNQVGREYMRALLEAMKRFSGGQSGGMEAAMSRLETAYIAVEKAVTNHQQKQKTNPLTETKILDPIVEELPVILTPVPPPKAAPAPVIPPVPVVLEPISVPTPVTVPPPKAAPAPVISATTKLADSPWSTPADFAIPAVAIKNENLPVESSSRSGSVASAFSNQATSEPLATTYKSTSVLEEKKNLTPQDLPTMSSVASRAQNGDSLSTPEIEAGLIQLLSDWSLFKKSGLFGTGPKGTEHPLYKRIADLQIPLLLAGRFEGSTQEIKQSITDYMNGWRYEQGIIYEKGETFERYLRRVIKQILDLQKKRPLA